MDTTINLPEIITGLQNGRYPKLGSGSGRRVYDLQNGMALKTAKNVRGYAQNQIEAIISEMDDSQLFAKVLFISKDNLYLVMEKAEPVTGRLQLYSPEIQSPAQRLMPPRQLGNAGRASCHYRLWIHRKNQTQILFFPVTPRHSTPRSHTPPT